MNFNDYFSKSYSSAKELFLKNCQKVDAKLFSIPIDGKTPNGKDLTINIALIGNPDPERILLHTSGLHGIEGFAGSAIQSYVLNNLPPISKNGAIILVHILNPYGMSWMRRTNGNNVDLNRNFLRSEDSWSGVTKGYQTLENFLNPKSPPGFDFFTVQALLNIYQFGFSKLKQSLACGQYEFPQGLFYGGNQLQSESELYENWLMKNISNVKYVFAIDIHSGLGKFGKDTLLMGLGRGKGVYQHLQKILGAKIRRPTIQDSIAYDIRGGLLDILPRLFPEAMIESLTQEFGTYSAFKIVHILREENRLFQYGKCSLDHPIKSKLKERFYPASKKWKESVLKLGFELVSKAARCTFAEVSLI